MWVIFKARLKSFWESPGHGDFRRPVRAWYTHVNHRTVAWQSWGDVKADFGSASLVGSCVVFNIGGNKYRLVTRIFYPSQKVFILKVMYARGIRQGPKEGRMRVLPAAANTQDRLATRFNADGRRR